MLALSGFLVLVVGFAVRLNPILVVVAAAFASGLGAGLSAQEVLEAFGRAFNENRFVSATFVILMMVGPLERAGLQERARTVIGRFRRVSVGTLLVGYFLFRQITSAVGLHPIAGHERTIRPLIAPMAEGAAEARLGPLDEETRQAVRAQCSAADNIALFFGEDVFAAIGSILLMVGFVQASGIEVEPLRLAFWAIPTAVIAFVVHSARLALFQRRLDAKGAGE